MDVATEQSSLKDPSSHTGKCSGACFRRWMLKNLLLLLMVLAMVLGVALGCGLRVLDPPISKRQIHYLKFPGDLLLAMLKMLILPLIISSLITGLSNLDKKATGKMGWLAVVYYLSTTIAAVILGIILVLAIQPGYGSDPDKSNQQSRKVNAVDSFLDLIRNMFPENLATAAFERKETIQVLTTYHVNFTNTSVNGTEDMLLEEYVPKVVRASGMNALGIIVFSLFLGGVISKMGEKGKPLADFFTALYGAVTYLITLVMWYAPLGIMFLIASRIVAMENAGETMSKLGKYIGTVIAGLIIHGYIVLPGLYFIIVRKNPYRFIYGMLQAIITALATASSAATLPITMKTLEQNNGVDLRVINFVTPIGATINMDGTALYEAVASIFIAQLSSITLDAGQVITISVTATLAAIGAAGIPQAGLVTMLIVLEAVGLPTELIGFIYTVDWFLDRCRTSVNVLGDGIGAGIIERLSLKEIQSMNEHNISTENDNHNNCSDVTYNSGNHVSTRPLRSDKQELINGFGDKQSQQVDAVELGIINRSCENEDGSVTNISSGTRM